MAFFKAFCIISTVLSPITGLNCPSLDDMPVTYYGDDFACAQWWAGHGNPFAPDSCNGLLKDKRDENMILRMLAVGYTDIMTDNQDWDAGEGKMYSMGSIAVMPGCTLYMYLNHDWTGTT